MAVQVDRISLGTLDSQHTLLANGFFLVDSNTQHVNLFTVGELEKVYIEGVGANAVLSNGINVTNGFLGTLSPGNYTITTTYNGVGGQNIGSVYIHLFPHSETFLNPLVHFTTARPGSDETIFGNGLHDTVYFGGNSGGIRSQFSIVHEGPIVTVTRPAAPFSLYGEHQVIGIEFLQFDDKTIFIENADNANIARLYSAAFNRAPDVSGLIFWEDIYARNISSTAKSAGYYVSLAQTNNGSGGSIATNFMQSSEFISRYGALTDSAFVTQLYQNVLGRGPDQAGLNFWIGQLGAGHQTREVVLVGFAESPENIAKTAADWLITI